MVMHIERQNSSSDRFICEQYPNFYQQSNPISISPQIRNKRKRSNEIQHYKRVKKEHFITTTTEYPMLQHLEGGLLKQTSHEDIIVVQHNDSQVFKMNNIVLNNSKSITPPQMIKPLEFESSLSCEAESYMIEGYNIWPRNSSMSTIDHHDSVTGSISSLR